MSDTRIAVLEAEVERMRQQNAALRQLLSRLLDYTAKVERAMSPWIMTRPGMAALPRTEDERKALGDEVRAALAQTETTTP
jgi:hypothetical protein